MLAGGILMSGVTMLLRILVLAGVLKQELLGAIFWPILAAVIVTLIGASILLWSASGAVADPPQLQIKNPFELATVFQLAALIALILLVAKALAGLAGTTGLFLLAAASGIADVDALTLSMTRLAGVQVVVGDAGTAIGLLP